MNTPLLQRIGLAAWGLLVLLQVLWHGWWLPPARMPIAVALAIALLPLAVPLVYWRRPQRALLVAGMIALFYFCHGVAEAFAVPAERALAFVEIMLSVAVVLGSARKPKRRGAAGSKLTPS